MPGFLPRSKWGKFKGHSESKIEHPSVGISEKQTERSYEFITLIYREFRYDRRELANYSSTDNTIYFNTDYKDKPQYKEQFEYLSTLIPGANISEFFNV